MGEALGDVAAGAHPKAQDVLDHPGGDGLPCDQLEPHEAGLVHFGGVKPQLVEVELDVVGDQHKVFLPEVGGVAKDGQVVGLLLQRGLHFGYPDFGLGEHVHGHDGGHGGLARGTEI